MNDQGSKFLVCWIIIFLAAMLAFYFGRKAGSPKKYGGLFGTLLVYSFYGFLPFLMMAITSSVLKDYLGVWSNGGDVDIGPTLTPLLVAPVYWVSVFIGMGMSNEDN